MGNAEYMGAPARSTEMFQILFDLEDYAGTYRETRDAYLKAANELKLATGPYKAARDSKRVCAVSHTLLRACSPMNQSLHPSHGANTPSVCWCWSPQCCLEVRLTARLRCADDLHQR